MVPILYESNETSFTTNGLGRLSDAIRVEVSEARNGEYELEMDYPLAGIHFDKLTEGRIILCSHDESGDLQPFDIYSSSKPLDGVVTFYGHHISYRLNEVSVKKFAVQGPVSTPTNVWGLMRDSYAQPSGGLDAWTFSTDITSKIVFRHDTDVARSFLGGSEGSFLDTWGGEFLFDKFTVNYLTRRGTDTSVHVRYRSNMTDFKQEVDISGSYTGILPYWQTSDGVATYGDVQYGSGTLPHGRAVVVPHDFSSDFENQPTAAQLNAAAQSYLTSNTPWMPAETLDVNFVQLWQTAEYADVAPLLSVGLCDTVLVSFPEYDIENLRVKVVSVTWDALGEKYTAMTLGTPSTSFAEAITTGTAQAQVNTDAQISNLTKQVEANATAIATKSNVLSTATYSGSIASIAAEQSQAVSINVARSGYTPIGIVGITKSGGGSGYVDIAAYSLSGTTATVQCHNANSGARSNIGVTVTVLYVAD